MIATNLAVSIVEDLNMDYPVEGCGVLLNKRGKLEWIHCTNVAEEEDEFKIDPQQYLAARLKGDIHAIVHSHPDYSSLPSEADKKASNFLGIPYYIVSLPAGDFSFYSPERKITPLMGRDYKFGENDCWSLARDYYKENLNIDLPTMHFEDDWWEKGLNYFDDLFEPFGFYEVDSPQEHDIILFSVMAQVPNHCGVYLGEGVFLHHAVNRLSCRESIYDRMWQANITRYARCKQLD